MTQRGPWSVKGIDNRAREAAREAAREEGMTLGAYLNKLILEEGEADPDPVDRFTASRERETGRPYHTRTPDAATTALDRLTRRIESAEARSTLAITGIDQSVVGLLSRLENAEHGQQAIGNHIDSVLDDVRRTHDSLREKVARLEADDSSETNLAALKSLEDALGKLASHVYEENALAEEETDAIKMRLETGLSAIDERLDAVDTQIEKKLDQATFDLKAAVESAELRAEGTARHLGDRFSALELEVADKLSHVVHMGEAMNTVQADMEASVDTVNETLGTIQERLNRAETNTDKALTSLEETFGELDQRLSDVAAGANPAGATELRRQFEERFEGLADDLRALIASARVEMAEEIEAASKSVDTNVIRQLEQTVNAMGERLDATEGLHAQTMDMVGDTVARVTESVDQRLTANQEQQSRDIQQVGDQVTRISESLDQRIQTIEENTGSANTEAMRDEMQRFTDAIDARLDQLETSDSRAIERVGSEMEKLADKLNERVLETEQRSATAIEQIGEQVSSVAGRLEHRQEEALRAFSEKMDATQKRQETRLSSALSNVSDRLEQMQQQSINSISPVQKAIAGLAQRIEAIEDFATPPFADRAEPPVMPEMATPEPIVTDLPDPHGDTPSTDDGGASFEMDNFLADLPDPTLPPLVEETFTAGLESWAEDANSMLDESLASNTVSLDTPLSTEDTLPENETDSLITPPPLIGEHEYFSDLPASENSWADSAGEARDADIFEDEPASSDASLSDFVTNIEAFEAAAETPAFEISTDAEDEGDYLSRARAAARAAATPLEKSKSPRAGRVTKKSATNSTGRVPTLAAVSALAVVSAGTAGFLYMRGKQPVQPVSLDVQRSAPDQAIQTAARGTAETAATSSTSNTEPTGDQLAVFASALNTEMDSADTADSTRTSEETDIAGNTPELDGARTFASVSLPNIPPSITLEQAAADGNAIAEFELGLQKLNTGETAEGAVLIQSAAGQGLAAAQYRLAKLHEQGLGVARDISEARIWTERAANGDNIKAMHDLAVYMTEGEGGAQSYANAAEWYRKAAEYGVVDSQFNLAVFYQDGLGISPSLTEALFWFELAARQGDPDARTSVDALREQISVEAAQQAQRRAQTWEPSTPDPVANSIFGSQVWNGGSLEQILAVQTTLGALGYDAGTPDGAIGGQTRAAIRAFETANNLPETGTINEALIEALNAAASHARGQQ